MGNKMEDEKTIEIMEMREYLSIGCMLPSLLTDGIITQLEFDRIIATRRLVDRVAAVYRLMVTRSKEESVLLLEIFRKLTVRISTEDISGMFFCDWDTKEKDMAHEEMIETPIPIKSTTCENTPLLNDVSVRQIFRFLSIKDLKNCRSVNKNWNLIAQPFISKRTVVHFKCGSLQPSTFIQAFDPLTPNLPFSQFQFSNINEQKRWQISELEEFFEKFGNKVMKLGFDDFRLSYALDKKNHFENYNITSWIVNSPHLTKLKIEDVGWGTRLEVPFEELTRVKSLTLTNCNLLIPPSKQYSLPAPSKISLTHVSLKQGRHVVSNYFLNDFFDFSKASKIVIDHSFNIVDGKMLAFDMAACVFDAKYLFLVNPKLIHWKEAQGIVRFLSICEFNFLEKNNLAISQLLVSYSKINISALPQTIEKLGFAEQSVIEKNVIGETVIKLQKLIYLYFKICSNNVTQIAHFANCDNLLELEIDAKQVSDNWILDLSVIPKSVKKLKIIGCSKLKITDNHPIFDLDILILEDSQNSFSTQVITKIKPKILVVKLNWSKKTIDTYDLIRFVYENEDLEQIVLGLFDNRDLHKKNQFDKSFFSGFVDKKSNFYIFKDHVGEALTQQEFLQFLQMDRLDRYL